MTVRWRRRRWGWGGVRRRSAVAHL